MSSVFPTSGVFRLARPRGARPAALWRVDSRVSVECRGPGLRRAQRPHAQFLLLCLLFRSHSSLSPHRTGISPSSRSRARVRRSVVARGGEHCPPREHLRLECEGLGARRSLAVLARTEGLRRVVRPFSLSS
ncbi:hypothetical protein FB451DRAFT_1418012 [Mycena latifolia]|nr:hypothetical protein FB451DRAFT_1418012 [Mycena latifolia]